jgi:hypothetical protein
VTQMYLYGPSEAGPDPEPPADDVNRLQLLVAVKAAPHPAERYGETVCVAGISTDLHRPGWIRLYPINFRELGEHQSFRKYDIITVDARPVPQDQRRESWRPDMRTMRTEHHLKQWKPRQRWLGPHLEDSMCRLDQQARERPDAKSLALIRPQDVAGLELTPHPGWTPSEQRKLELYGNRFDLFNERDRAALAAPRFRGAYRYRCHEHTCAGHRQEILDWEFVALQRRLAGLPDGRLRQALENNYLGRMCGADRDVAFYVGNQAHRTHVFSVLGVYWPPRY